MVYNHIAIYYRCVKSLRKKGNNFTCMFSLSKNKFVSFQMILTCIINAFRFNSADDVICI